MAGSQGSPNATFPQYTNLALGEGLFDQLMQAVKHHLDIEYKANRITKDTYAKVYLGAMEAALGNTTQYLLGNLLIGEKKAQAEADIAKTEAETRQIEWTTDYLLPAQLAKLQAETALISEQILLTQAQVAKTNKEIEFLTAKILTEQANTDETIADLGSLVGRQIDLLRIQGLGFAGDLEAKAAKMHADYDSLFQSVQENPADVYLTNNSINQIIGMLETVEKMKDKSYVDPVFTPPVTNP
jgi:septal ring factor EnvC (AmiA/AmiB activator)